VLRAVLVDVGGTLWPDRWEPSEREVVTRLEAVQAVLPGCEPALVDSMVSDTDRDAGSRRRAGELIAAALERDGRANDDRTVTAVRRALCAGCPTAFEGARDLLAWIRTAGLRCVIVSNTTLRDAVVYARDFATLGWADWIDGCLTSVDAGCAKPDPRIFELALGLAQAQPRSCAMVGDSEEADIAPAAELGLKTIRVGIEQPIGRTQADAAATSLAGVLEVLRSWV